MGSRTTRRGAVKATCVLLVLLAVGWAATAKPTASMTQEEYYHLATQSQHGAFGTYPEPREVVVHRVDKTYLSLAFEYFKRAATGSIETAGGYHDQTRTILLDSEIVCASACLPGPLQLPFVHTLRHEYGHAFAEDVLKAAADTQMSAEGEPFLAYTESNASREAAAEICNMPAELEPVVEDWRQSSETLYGPPYFTSTFNEYLAESYARFLGGHQVPEATRQFFESYSDK